MDEASLLAECKRLGYQLVPLPDVIDHEFRPGDRVVEDLEPWVGGIAKKFDIPILTNRKGTILAVASRADVMVRFDDGRVGFFIVKGLSGQATFRKLKEGE